MKKILLVIIAVAAWSTAAGQSFSWGVKAGVNFASVYGDVDNVKLKIDFVGGVFGEFKTNNWFGVSAELLYAGQGYKIANEDIQVNTANFNIPIMANFHVSRVVSLGTGIQPGFMLGAKAKGNGETADMKDKFNTFALAIPINVRFQLGFGLLFDVRYNLGVTNIVKNAGDANCYNDGFAVAVGWKF